MADLKRIKGQLKDKRIAKVNVVGDHERVEFYFDDGTCFYLSYWGYDDEKYPKFKGGWHSKTMKY